MKASLLLDAKATLAEGPFWHPEEQLLYWVDIEQGYLHIYNPETKEDRLLPTGTRIGEVVPVKGDGAIVALQNGLHKIDTQTGALEFITNPLAEDIRFNDGRCDPSGRFWIGSMALDERNGAAALYRFDKDKSIHLMLDNVSISNGIVWTSDKKKMYYVDSPTKQITEFDYDDITGEISNRRVAVDIKIDGFPDGMIIDNEDKLWTALWGGCAVARWDPETSELLQKIEVDALHVSACTFGGKNLNTLYITTARKGLNAAQLEEYPLSGSLFAIDLDIKGVPTEYYQGCL